MTIPAYHVAEMDLDDFRKYQTGGPSRNMKNTEVTIDFYNGSTLVGQMTVGIRPN